MKILHVAYFGQNGKLNGVSEAVISLSMAQQRMGHDVKIAITTHHSIIDDNFIIYVPSTNVFANVVENFAPDIVSFHSLYEVQQITFSHILRKRQVPYVLVFHGGASKDNAKKGWLKKKIANLLMFNWFIHKAEAVIYLSQNEYEKSVFKRINKKYYIIPNGVKLPIDPPQQKLDKKINVTYLSRIDFYGKGLDILLLSIKHLLDEGWSDKIFFTFYGNHYDDSYKKLLEFGNFVQYKGFVSGEQKEQAFIESSINILPSRSEGMPMTILEALSFGRPCMVTPMTNMAELIAGNKCGWVIDLTEDSIVDQIKNAYAELKENPNVYFENCRRVAKEYSWENVAKKSIEAYKSVL